ncbi:anti-sigma factor family protein [Acidobacteriota bacterium]
MNSKCRRVRKWLPLYIGEELAPGRLRATALHLQTCRECAAELESYRVTLDRAKTLLSQDNEVWEESDWNRMVSRAIHSPRESATPLAPWPYRNLPAWLTMTAAALFLGFIIVSPVSVSKILSLSADRIAEYRSQPLWESEKKPVQDVVSMTLVSQETGLKIVWFFNKNFDLEVKK